MRGFFWRSLLAASLLAASLALAAPALAQEPLDTAKLPRASGGKEVFASPAATIFTSPGSVAVTAEALTKALAGAGWQAYTAPFTSRSTDPTIALLSLKRGRRRFRSMSRSRRRRTTRRA